MSTLAKIKTPLLVVCGLVLATAAILIGTSFIGGSSSKQSPTTAEGGPWRSIAAAPKPVVDNRTVVWTGSEMIVAGVNPGPDGTFIHPAEIAESYNPATDTWRRLATPPMTPNYCRRGAVWTGKEMLVWGCALLSFDPATKRWTRLSDPPTHQGIVAWTGHELIGWGGGCCGDAWDVGSAYNPKTNTWRKLAAAPVSGQQTPTGAWTGRELVILNGDGPEGGRVGAAYDPASDTWRRIPSQAGLLGGTAVWDGNEIGVVGAGNSVFAFNPTNDHWRALPKADLGKGPFVAVSTGHLLIASGQKTAAYEAHADRWTALPSSPLPLRDGALAIWTGRSMIIWGGVVGTPGGTTIPPRYVVDGAALTPPRIPDPPNLDGSAVPLPQCC